MTEWTYNNGYLEMRTPEGHPLVEWVVPIPAEVIGSQEELNRFTELHLEGFADLVQEAARHAA